MVLAIRLFRWQYNASNRVIFRRQISMEFYYRVGLHAY